jgi:outer membrane immunogenic protein
MRYKILCAGLLASVAAGAGAALAADIAGGGVAGRPGAVAVVPAPSYINEWSGFYVGIHGGGGWEHESISPSEFEQFDNGAPFPLVTPPGTNGSGGLFGFQFGHNWQWGPVVGGLEIDFSGTDIQQTNTFVNPATAGFNPFTHDFKVDDLASARGRLGYLVWPSLLLFGTAGIGWGHFEVTNSFVFPGFTNTSTADSNEFGWVAGAGLEWKFANNWLLRGEWLHYDFDKVTNPNNNAILNQTFLIDNGNIRTTVDVARAAISYKFTP